MSLPSLKRRLMNDGTLGPQVMLGDLFESYGSGNTPLTTWAAAIDTAMAAITAAATAMNLASGTTCLSTPGLAEGTNANTIQIATAFTYTIGGTRYTKEITDNVALTAAAVQATDTNCIYLICIDSAGTVSSVKGTAVAAASAAACPATPADVCAIGWLHVATASAATFTAGSTDLGAANVTDTFVNFVGSDPGRAATVTTALTTMNTAITTTLNAALVAAIPPAL